MQRLIVWSLFLQWLLLFWFLMLVGLHQILSPIFQSLDQLQLRP